ncbi:hypothetical protein L218DRAFT_949254 [Marasmius fiardii PR-910]|nr:hypothetical protein L218DRAFT_949254 [Marasmius fiardii PR-910]
MYSPPMQSSKSKHASTNAINANRIAGGNFYSAAAEQTINNSPQVQNNAQGCSTTIVNNYYQSVDSAQQHLNNRGTARGEEAAMVPTDKEVNQGAGNIQATEWLRMFLQAIMTYFLRTCLGVV